MHINKTVGQIKRVIKIESDLDDSFFIKQITSLECAGEHDVAVLFDRGQRSVFKPVDLEKVKQSKAGLIIAKSAVVPGKNYLITSDPLLAFQQLVDFVETQDAAPSEGFSCHETAVVDKTAVIGKQSSVGAHVFIGKNVVIGQGVTLYPGVKILDRCIIGNNAIIHAGSIIGSDGFGYSVTQTGLKKIPQIGIVKIGNNVEIGANSCIDRAAFEKTVIGNGVKIDNQVHVSHNVKIGDHSAVLAQTAIAGGVVIGIGCQIGGQVAIKDHVTIGNGAKIVSKSAVMRNVKDGEVVCGVPAVPFSHWKRVSVVLYKLPDLFKDFRAIKSFLDKKKNSFWGRFFR